MWKLLKNLSFYSLGEILNKSIQFLLLPLYAHYLIPADYGKLELTYLYGAVLVIFYGFIIENGYSRLFFDKKETGYRDLLFGTSFFFKLVSGAVFLAVSLVLAGPIAGLLFNFENGAMYVRLISVSVFIKSLAEIPLKTLIVEKRAGRYVINNLFYLLVSLSSTVYFVVFLHLNIAGVLYGQILGAVVQLLTLLYTEWKWSFLSFSISHMKGMLYFSLFLIPSQLASFVTYWSNRLFLQKFASLEDVGTFSFGYKIASIIPILLTQPIKKAIGPEIYELIDRPDECKKRIRQLTLIIFMALALFALALSMFARELIALMASKAYASSHEVVFVLSLGYVFIGMAGIAVTPIQISKKTWLITITWVLSSIANIALNYALVPSFGKAGATYASLITFMFILGLYFLFGEWVYKVGFEYGKYFMIVGITCIAYFAGTSIDIHSLPMRLLFKTVIIACSSAVMYFKIVSARDRARLKGEFSSKIAFRGRVQRKRRP